MLGRLACLRDALPRKRIQQHHQTVAIGLAGGFTDFAAKNKVKIVRGEGSAKKIIYVNVNKIMAGKKDDIFLQPGDMIQVLQSFF